MHLNYSVKTLHAIWFLFKANSDWRDMAMMTDYHYEKDQDRSTLWIKGLSVCFMNTFIFIHLGHLAGNTHFYYRKGVRLYFFCLFNQFVQSAENLMKR